MTPTQLLQQELDKWKKALEYSKRDFIQGKITLCEHETHVSNLEPKINSYVNALRILRFYTE
jgi:hypothetical protein